MGGSQAKEAPILKENPLDAASFILIDCKGDDVLLSKDLLDNLAQEYNTSLDTFPDFKSKCLALRKVIKNSEEAKLKAKYISRPPLSIALFESKKCDEIVSDYSHEEWRKFYEDNKKILNPYADMIEGNLLFKNIWDVPMVCKTIRKSLIGKKLIKGDENEQKSLENLNRQINLSKRKETEEKISKLQKSVK